MLPLSVHRGAQHGVARVSNRVVILYPITFLLHPYRDRAKVAQAQVCTESEAPAAIAEAHRTRCCMRTYSSHFDSRTVSPEIGGIIPHVGVVPV